MVKFYLKVLLVLSVIIGLGMSLYLFVDDGVIWVDIENDVKMFENVLMYGMGLEV